MLVALFQIQTNNKLLADSKIIQRALIAFTLSELDLRVFFLCDFISSHVNS